MRVWILILLVGVLGAGCAHKPATATLPAPNVQPSEGGEAMQLLSDAFKHGDPIPRPYTCDGADQSVPLKWTDPPADTQSFALIMDDPDAPMGTWVHWVLYAIPATTRALPAGISNAATLPDGSRHGKNSWGKSGYGGPCPPRGTHRYFFKLYALDTVLDLAPGATKEQLLKAMEGHILAQAELMGTYKR